MIRDVTRHCATFLTICLAILVEAGVDFQILEFYWLINRNIARQIAKSMLHRAIAKNGDEMLRQMQKYGT